MCNGQIDDGLNKSRAMHSQGLTVMSNQRRRRTQLLKCIHCAVQAQRFAKGLGESPLVTLDAAASVIQRGNNKVAGYELNAFIHEVSAQPGKGMMSEQAAELGTRAKQAIAN